MKISFINIIFSYKRVTSLGFSEHLLCLLFRENNQLKIILKSKWHTLGWHILLPFAILTQINVKSLQAQSKKKKCKKRTLNLPENRDIDEESL